MEILEEIAYTWRSGTRRDSNPCQWRSIRQPGAISFLVQNGDARKNKVLIVKEDLRWLKTNYH